MQQLFERQELLDFLKREGASDWADQIQSLCRKRLNAQAHGTLPKWVSAWESMPECNASRCLVNDGHVVLSVSDDTQLAEAIDAPLREFHPWRKGPFSIFGCEIDTEWRSDLKWDRLQEAVEFRERKVLDVGCGNGYYGWRMLAEGAAFVLGCDPFLLYVMQFEVVRRYVQQAFASRHFVVPLTDDEVPEGLKLFDIVCSMGVLYHRTGPIDHLRRMHSALKPGGQLLLETIIVEADDCQVLVPKGRYAKMRNVWFLPSVPMLELWLARTGFTNIRIIDCSRTTVQEQRRTEWMTFESLADFLDPADSTRTIEGYPSPVRVMLVAEARQQ